MDDLRSLRFRSNPDFELVSADRLQPAEAVALRELEGDPGFYGILRPGTESGLPVKQVDPDLALLFLTLREPGHLPAYVHANLGNDADRFLARLVLDRVLEVEVDGRFLSGPAAASFFEGPETEPVPHALAAVSARALQHATAFARSLPRAAAPPLARQLYLYNQIPLSPRWLERLPGTRHVERFLGLGKPGPLRRRLSGAWRPGPESPDGPWLSWNRRASGGFPDGTPQVWKLYISPHPEDLPPAFRATVDVLSDSKAVSLKVGNSAPGLLRSDKMVAYFNSRGDLAEAAGSLVPKLRGARAQGVPFTAPLDPKGAVVSWGVDRFGPEKRLSWETPESWRMWVTNRLAVALASAVTLGSPDAEVRRFVLSRIRMEGIDPDTWTPGNLEPLARPDDPPAEPPGARGS